METRQQHYIFIRSVFMKESMFTTVLPLDEYDSSIAEVLIHNTLTNALSILSSEKYNFYKKILEGSDDGIPKSFIDELTENGFILDDDIDEIKKFEYIHASNRFDTSTLVLTIAPSLDCQFGCPYCYEAGIDRSKTMSQETQNALISFIRQKNPKSIHVHWYGGEPLMQMDIIESLTEQILTFCKDNVVGYTAEMVTNAYLLNENMLNRLLHCKIKKVQITIDGPKEIHDSRRFLIGGGPTYNIIMDNIENALGRLDIDLRVNIDKTNEDKLEELTAELVDRNILDNVHAYIGHVTSTDEYGETKCISRKRYADLSDQWYDQLSQYSKANKYTKLYRYPLQTATRCIIETASGYVVDPDGLLYKCWNHIGREEFSIGKITDKEIKISSLLLNYLMSQDILEQGCIKCKMLPYCGGGCLDEYLRYGIRRCHPRKYNYNRYLIDLAREMLASKVKQNP